MHNFFKHDSDSKLLWVGIGVFYIFTHLVFLTKLPVFADEAIYIRWSQLMIDDWSQYAFFPLNDGKTPLQMWLMVPLLRTFSEPLFAGRLLSVIVGGAQVAINVMAIKMLGGKKIAQIIGSLLTTLLPFWFFHHRMALIDGLFTLFISTTCLGLIQIGKAQTISLVKNWRWIVIAGLSWGLALLSKLPALFFAPVFPLFGFVAESVTVKQLSKRWIFLGLSGFIGLAIFGLLKLHPAFGQLFSRGQDFTFTLQEILAGQWRTSLDNVWRILSWNIEYLSVGTVMLGLSSPFIIKQRKLAIVLLLSMLIFSSPFIIFGRVLAPRYLLPMAFFLTVLASVSMEKFTQISKTFGRIFVTVILLSAVLASLKFMYTSYWSTDDIPFVEIDREQYLEEWSSGHGVKETVGLIQEYGKKERVLVLSEGYFGTLPDGLLMYFHGQNVENIFITGIGAPVNNLPQNFEQMQVGYDTVLLVVNSHRMFLDKEEWKLIEQFERPNSAPSLQVYKYENVVSF